MMKCTSVDEMSIVVVKYLFKVIQLKTRLRLFYASGSYMYCLRVGWQRDDSECVGWRRPFVTSSQLHHRRIIKLALFMASRRAWIAVAVLGGGDLYSVESGAASALPLCACRFVVWRWYELANFDVTVGTRCCHFKYMCAKLHSRCVCKLLYNVRMDIAIGKLHQSYLLYYAVPKSRPVRTYFIPIISHQIRTLIQLALLFVYN